MLRQDPDLEEIYELLVEAQIQSTQLDDFEVDFDEIAGVALGYVGTTAVLLIQGGFSELYVKNELDDRH